MTGVIVPHGDLDRDQSDSATRFDAQAVFEGRQRVEAAVGADIQQRGVDRPIAVIANAEIERVAMVQDRDLCAVGRRRRGGRQARREGVPFWTRDQLFALFPNLSERRGNLGKALSGGEQQMLTIARTLMGNPRLLLLDEPSEGIAPVIVEQMAETILKLKAERLTVLLSEQNLHFARLVADRALIIEGGSIRFDGTFAELEANTEIRDAYLSV